jgi:hypothetical protein
MNALTQARPIALARGDVLRIRDGGGITLRPQSGVLWITEEAHGDDRIVAPGDVCRLEGMGLALVYAHRASRVAIDVPATAERVPDLRVAVHGADVSRPVALEAPAGARGLLARLRVAWRELREASAARSLGPVAVGGYAEHDLFVSSRRRRGAGGAVDVDPRDPMRRFFFPYY